MASSSFFSILNHQDISPNHYADILRTWDVDTQSLPQFVSEINLKLHKTGDERIKGIFLLEWFLLHANPALVVDEAVGWMLQCLRNDCNSGAGARELMILHELLHKSKDFPDVKRVVGNTVLPKFVETLCNNDESKNVRLWKLKCLKFFQIYYSGPCGLHRNPTQKFIISILSNSCEGESALHSAAADCFALSSQCGSRGKLGVSVMKDSWSNEYQRIMNTIWFTALKLFDGINLIWKPNKKYEDSDLISFSDTIDVLTLSPIERYYYLKRRFVVLLKILGSMILVKFPVSKCFEALAILDIVHVVCSVSNSQICAEIKTTDAIIINAFMPDLYVAVMDLLAALIRCGRRNLLPNSIAICRLCTGILKDTGLAHNQWAYGDAKPFQRVRVRAYCTLSQWMTEAKTCSSIEVFGSDIFVHILEDIHFEKPAVTLVAKKNKDAQKKTAQPENCNSKMVNGNEVIDPKANNLVCKEALMTFQLIIYNTSMLLKPEHYKNVQEAVVSTLLEIQSCNDISEYPIPYSDNACRLELYRSLLTLATELLCAHSVVVSSISIFNEAIHDSDPKIVQFANIALTQMEPIIHPRGPALELQMESHRNIRSQREGDEFTELFSFKEVENEIAKSDAKNEKNERTITPLTNQSCGSNLMSKKDSKDKHLAEDSDDDPFDIYLKRPVKKVAPATTWCDNFTKSLEKGKSVPIKDVQSSKDNSCTSLEKRKRAFMMDIGPATIEDRNERFRGTSSVVEPSSQISNGDIATLLKDFVPEIKPKSNP